MYTSLQACRAVAAVLVVLFHLGIAISADKYFGATAFEQPFSFGKAGVNFFFVLSGYIISRIHLADFGNPRRLWAYCQKRFVRIYPTYWMVFIAVCFAASLSPTLRLGIPHDPSILLRSLLLLPQDKLVVGGTGAPVLIVAWSLQYEMTFYALVALFVLNRIAGIAALLLVLANMGHCQIAQCRFPDSFLASHWVLLFLYGVLIAYWNGRLIKLRSPLPLAIAGIAIFLALGFAQAAFELEVNPGLNLLYGFVSGLIIIGLVQSEDLGKVKIPGWIGVLGDASYVLYLIHYPMIILLCKLAVFSGLRGYVGAAIAYPIILAVCLISAVCFHILIERPVLLYLSPRRRPKERPAIPAECDERKAKVF